MVAIEIQVILLLIIFLLYFFQNSGKKFNLPPGPRGLPFVGNAFSIEKKSYETFGKWATKFGNIITVNIFGTRIVIISDTSVAREAYNSPSLLGRAYVKPFEVYFRGDQEYPKEVAPGILSSEGSQWVEQRRFTLRHLRDFGFGKQNCMEEHIQAESSILLSFIKALDGKEVELWRPLAHASSNVLWRIIAGNRITEDEEKSKIIETAASNVLNFLDSPTSVFLPWISQLFGAFSGWNSLVRASVRMQNLLRSFVVAHQENFVPEKSSVPKDFIEAYLLKIADTKDTLSSFYGENGVHSLNLLVSDLFIAGSETTGATINWAVLYLTTFPNVQKRFSEEINDVIGNTRPPSLQDRSRMPYTEAIINETLRKSTFSTFGVMHRATGDTELNGYTIPKDTWVCVNHHFIHHDPKIWGDPENFRPERFLSTETDGTVVIRKYEELIPFSVGKRFCIGEQLARDEIFLFLCAVYQKYRTVFDPTVSKPRLEPRSVMFKHAPFFSVIFEDNKFLQLET